MKRIVIFEGIASSGKTTLERMLNNRIKDSALITEGKTLIPIFDLKDPHIATEHLLSVIDEAEKEEADTIIIDRLHLPQAFRTKSSLKTFHMIEQRLCEKDQSFSCAPICSRRKHS